MSNNDEIIGHATHKKTKQLVRQCREDHVGVNKMREHDLDLLRVRLQEIKEMGCVRNQRPGNAGVA